MAPPPPKKRKTTTLPAAPEKISFDPDARAEYLTGFHKRKVARTKHAQEENAKREKEEKLRFRRELRQQRKDDLEKHVAEVNRLVRQANGDLNLDLPHDSSSSDNDDDFKGFPDPSTSTPSDPPPLNIADEYLDADKHTTVTIESVTIDRSGFSRPGDVDEEAEMKRKKAEETGAKRVWTKAWPKSDKPKVRKKKFRYETKVERKAERFKQGLKKKKQAAARKGE
ncbi:hypothetical protein P153DRAFT_427905 [Dothidotthia symphoricarpi CBS 119687]|uniref:Nucleolar protein 12 n=1 Tax=Dothidotthia symphoricarpi CBS 119687 TaxID=1392245 RepID=A0A6A6APW3_9PLEO|nr:uncharacterized protein P153DRAFT_427905 [Dothidotthia symphoricarpi CBS 119687]KAF2134032.1 hypothetical protein P153DRAFT_427905 [Dothidotthia symphoricarpi CBS 119687]